MVVVVFGVIESPYELLSHNLSRRNSTLTEFMSEFLCLCIHLMSTKSGIREPLLDVHINMDIVEGMCDPECGNCIAVLNSFRPFVSE